MDYIAAGFARGYEASMKQLTLVGFAVCAYAACAIAGADKEVIPMAPAQDNDFSWTGFYVGGHIGYGFSGGDKVHFSDLLGFGNAGDTAARTLVRGTAAISPSSRVLDPDGFVVGGGIGYNYQFCKRWLVGAEADFDGSTMSAGSASSVSLFGNGNIPPGPYPFGLNEDVNWFGTVRGRIGYIPTPRVLLYGTAGFAYADYSFSSVTNFSSTEGPILVASQNDTKTGWTAGGGIEVALCKHWTFKAEYLFVDCGTLNGRATAPDEPFFVNYQADTSAHLKSPRRTILLRSPV